MKTKLALIFFGFALIILVMPYLIVKNPLGIMLVDFSGTGEIGDTIGGITAPLVGLLSAFLVYMAFSAQVEANKIQADAIKLQQVDREMSNFIEVTKMLDELIKEVKFVSAYIEGEVGESFGNEAIRHYYQQRGERSRQLQFLSEMKKLYPMLNTHLKLMVDAKVIDKDLVIKMADIFSAKYSEVIHLIRLIGIKPLEIELIEAEDLKKSIEDYNMWRPILLAKLNELNRVRGFSNYSML